MELLSRQQALSPANLVVYQQPAIRAIHIPQVVTEASVPLKAQAAQWHSFFRCRLIKLPLQQ